MLKTTYRAVRRLLVFLVGSSVVLAGIVMVVTPGPAFIVIPAGLALLATEFLWARALLTRLKRSIDARMDRARRGSTGDASADPPGRSGGEGARERRRGPAMAPEAPFRNRAHRRRPGMRARARASVALLAAAMLAATGAGAAESAPRATGFADAARLRALCLGRGAARATCLGYLGGAIDALVNDGARGLCLPPKLAAEQARLLFLNHLHAHPERAARSAAAELKAALGAAFPCPEPRPGQTPDAAPAPGERISRSDNAAPGASTGPGADAAA